MGLLFETEFEVKQKKNRHENNYFFSFFGLLPGNFHFFSREKTESDLKKEIKIKKLKGKKRKFFLFSFIRLEFVETLVEKYFSSRYF